MRFGAALGAMGKLVCPYLSLAGKPPVTPKRNRSPLFLTFAAQIEQPSGRANVVSLHAFFNARQVVAYSDYSPVGSRRGRVPTEIVAAGPGPNRIGWFCEVHKIDDDPSARTLTLKVPKASSEARNV